MEIAEATLNELISIVKADLQIDFDDDDNRIKNLILDGTDELSRICGVVTDDFKAGGKANALLLAYVRRAYDGDLTSFRNDYKSEIMTLKSEREYERYVEEQSTDLQ